MTSQRTAITGAVLAVLLGNLPVANAQQAEPTELRVAQCVSCHGVRGVASNPMYPHLAGQQEGYLQLQLEAFHSGERYHPLMTPVAQSLTSEDMAVLARYYSSLSLPPAMNDRE